MRGLRRLLRALVLGACLGASLPVIALDQYVIGVEEIDYLPYHDGRGGHVRGFARDLFDAFAAAQGVEFVYRPLPPARLLASLLNDRVDFKFPDNPQWRIQRRAGVRLFYSQPIVAYEDGTLVRPDQLGDEVGDIHVLGTVVGFTPQAWQTRLDAGTVTLRESLDFLTLLTQLMNGRINAIYANVRVAEEQSSQLQGKLGGLVLDPALPHLRSSYRLSTRRYPQLLQRFDRWLIDSHEQVRAIADEYRLSVDDLQP